MMGRIGKQHKLVKRTSPFASLCIACFFDGTIKCPRRSNRDTLICIQTEGDDFIFVLEEVK